MPQTHTLGRAYWHKIRLQKDAPRHHRWPTFEYEWPHRQSQAHIVRLAGKLGIAFGWWHGDKLDGTEAAFKAIQGREERPDVVGEGGTSVDDHRELVYMRERVKEILANGWTVS